MTGQFEMHPLTLYIESEGREGVFRLQWRAETQGTIIDGFSEMVREVDGGHR